MTTKPETTPAPAPAPAPVGPLAGIKSYLETNPLATAITAAGVVAVLFFLLMFAIQRGQLFFPLWSSIVYPMLAVSPFIILMLKIPTPFKVALGLIIVLLIMPVLGLKDSFYLELAIQIAIFASLALGLNIVVGFAGLLDLGYVAFFAVGAYLWGIFASTSANTVIKANNWLVSPDAFYLFLAGGILLAALVGILLGLPVLRLKGDYLAIVTLGFGEMIRLLMSNLSNISSDPEVKINITNGAQGLPGILEPRLPQFVIDGVSAFGTALGFPVSNPNATAHQLFYYLLVLAFAGLVVLFAARLDNSPIGRAWTAIREDEIAARAMGVPLVRMKLLAFATGAAFAGAMGVIFAAKQKFVSPESFSFEASILILVIVIVGGMGSIRGVIFGAITVVLLDKQILQNVSLLLNSFKTSTEIPEALREIFRAWPPQLEPAKYQRFVFGIMLVLMMIFRPAGILPASRRRLELAEAMGKEKEVEKVEKAKQEASNAAAS